MKIGLILLSLILFSCGKEETVPVTGQTVDEFTRGYQDQIGKNGVAKQGETINLFQEIRFSMNGCTYDYSFGERVIINNNPKLIKIYSRDVWRRVSGPLQECEGSKVDEVVYQIPANKLQELYLSGVANKCNYLRRMYDDQSRVSFCSQNYLGQTTFRSESAGVFKTTLSLNVRGTVYNLIDNSTHLANKFLWVPYPVAQRTLVNGRETRTKLNKVVTDYYSQEVDERNYDQFFVRDYYPGWEL